MLFSRDGGRMLDNSNSGSTRFQKQLETTTGRITVLKFRVMETQATLEPTQVSAQDGGNFSKRKVI